MRHFLPFATEANLSNNFNFTIFIVLVEKLTHHSDAVWDLRSSETHLASTGMDGRLAVFEVKPEARGREFTFELKFCIQGLNNNCLDDSLT